MSVHEMYIVDCGCINIICSEREGLGSYENPRTLFQNMHQDMQMRQKVYIE